jgi:hypothetical protein
MRTEQAVLAVKQYNYSKIKKLKVTDFLFLTPHKISHPASLILPYC